VDISVALWNGLRSIFLRAPRLNPLEAGPALFIGLVVVYLATLLGLAVLEVPPPWTVGRVAVIGVLADSLLTLAAAWVLMRVMQRDGIVWGVACALLAATIMTEVVVHTPLTWLTYAALGHGHLLLAHLADALARFWWLAVLFGVARWLAPKLRGRAVLAAFLGFAVSAMPWWWLPPASILTTATAPSPAVPTPAALPKSLDTTPEFDAEDVIYNQQALLDDAIAKLKPQTPGVVDLYVVAFAGDAREDVFRNEAEYAEQLFTKRFNADGRVLVLENNAATVATRPLATLTNLGWALDDIAKTMDPAEDVLLLYVTTHGSHDHELLVDLDPLPLDQIAPEDLADALKTSPGIRWKVVVVNACYSGGFIDALRDDSTMVITSARADRTSFGCGADSDITYFAKAFFAEALNRTTSIPDAFAQAKKSVTEWEDANEDEHSEPQIATTRSIENKLEAWQKKLKPGEPVPFAPAESDE